ncbi:MAG: hypothetical protein P9M05_07350, partial [Candidatus Stygibacter australis]|nr:hypothetical protein [Candidatus Stygibacter australis]
MQNKIMFSLLIFLVFVLNAQINDIPVTRNLMPDEHPVESYEDYISNLVQVETSYQEVINRTGRERGSWLAFVESGLYDSLETELAVWNLDLEQEGYNLILIEWAGTSAEDLKDVIINYYNFYNINGVFLLGNLPVAWFELWEDWDGDNVQGPGEEWVEFPIDQYFADLDGLWDDLDGDGVYDLHEEELDAELAISRLRADNLSYAGAEVEILRNWFERNNLYRNGVLEDSDQALGYIDDDWAYWDYEYQAALELCYTNVEMISEVNSTTA